MVKQVEWKALKREKLSQGQMKDKRKEGFVPVNLNFRGKDSMSLFIDGYSLQNRPYGNFKIELAVEGEKEVYTCFLKDLQYGHVANLIIHADLQGLTKGQELDMDVVIELVGESIGIKNGGALNLGVSSVKIRTLPRNMPSKFEVDISELNIGDSIDVKDMTFKAEHVLIEPVEGMIVSIAERKVYVEEEAGDTDLPTEPEILSEKEK